MTVTVINNFGFHTLTSILLLLVMFSQCFHNVFKIVKKTVNKYSCFKIVFSWRATVAPSNDNCSIGKWWSAGASFFLLFSLLFLSRSWGVGSKSNLKFICLWLKSQNPSKRTRLLHVLKKTLELLERTRNFWFLFVFVCCKVDFLGRLIYRPV